MPQRILSILPILLSCLAWGWPTQPAAALDKVTLATNWLAQPELGGFYQAAVDGTFRKYGLDVTIRPGGPLVNNRPLLAFGQVEFLVGTNLLQPFDAAKQGIPTQVVAAFFQKDPQCLLAHPGQGYEKWEDLTRAPLYLSNAGRHSFFLWMKAVHGFQAKNLRPYNHSLAPFLVDKSAVVQGYVTAEPFRVQEAGGAKPLVFLMADHGWNGYSTVLEARTEFIQKQPDVVQRFVDASIEGWRNYVDGRNIDATNARIRRENKSMTPELIAYSREEIRKRQLVDGGDAPELGIGGIDLQRVANFYGATVEAGLFKQGEIDPAACVTTRFVNRGEGRPTSAR
ncbi:MAG: nitrate ABC transporter substrate-binding protein [Planctomycetaceae bacterium]|nr:nitrate ABC transporter substrate-binding protein [Planctomycetaceae bacterium]